WPRTSITPRPLCQNLPRFRRAKRPSATSWPIACAPRRPIWTRWLSPTVANSVQPLRRLAGLETEYAIRMPASAATPRSHYELYESLIPPLRLRIPLADAALDKMGHFLANGGAIWFEMVRLTGEYGLIEGSTPECRGPRQLLTYQRAQDQLFAEAAASVRDGPFTLLKNCRDSVGNYYGAQENYEFPLASGARLALWRIGVAMLAPLIPLTWIGLLARVLIYIVLLLAYIVISHLAFLLAMPFVRDRTAIRRWLIDGILTSQGSPVENWMETALNL